MRVGLGCVARRQLYRSFSAPSTPPRGEDDDDDWHSSHSTESPLPRAPDTTTTKNNNTGQPVKRRDPRATRDSPKKALSESAIHNDNNLNQSHSNHIEYDESFFAPTCTELETLKAFLRGDETAEVTRRTLSASSLKKKHPSTMNSQQQRLLYRRTLRRLLVDVPLALLCALWVGTWLLRDIHNVYYRPLFHRARRTDEQLTEEYTYYDRQCTEYDLSTRNIHDMVVEYDSEATASNSSSTSSSNANAGVVHQAVDQMMTHGVTIVPHILPPHLTTALREYLVSKNRNITAAEAYPMSQGERRLSYGIDASEDPAVSNAIAHVAHHPIVRPLLATLLGDDDPASAEITAITAYDGAANQVWHQDTKQDGNAIKFARTYSHSYSLFLPLQDTTGKMGATDICPGTHYCVNDLSDLCDFTKMGLHRVGGPNEDINAIINTVDDSAEKEDPSDDYVLPAGAGALLNQHVWHRGGAHTDPTAPERIVFILSFLARPAWDTGDTRQLSRGTYFHQKWTMWGHTWYDLLDPAVRMRHPFSLWRCLSVWKPAAAGWGYDLITSGFLRFVNEQLEYEDFEERFLPRLDQWKVPKFLRGRHVRDVEQRITWQVFIKDTLDKVYDFCASVTLYAHVAYVIVVLVVALIQTLRNRRCADGPGGGRLVRRTIRTLVVTRLLLLLSGWYIWDRIRHSPWGQSIVSGRALMRPFPPVDLARATTTVSVGPTTMPTRYDVLVGSRFDAAFLGSYQHWLDYHPGNVVYRQAVAHYGQATAATIAADSVLTQAIVQGILQDVQRQQGRFLHQDFRTGDWHRMTDEEVRKVVTSAVKVQQRQSLVLSRMQTHVDARVAHWRFGPLRETALARGAELLLWELREDLWRVRVGGGVATTTTTTSQSDRMIDVPSWSVAPSERLPMTSWMISSSVPKMPSLAMNANLLSLDHRHNSLAAPRGPSDIAVGSLVWYNYHGDWFPGTVMGCDDRHEWFQLSFEDNSWEDGIPREALRPFTTIVQGDFVMGCFVDGLEDCFPGTVQRVWPSGNVDIAFDDGDFEIGVPPPRYFVPPYRYEGPFNY